MNIIYVNNKKHMEQVLIPVEHLFLFLLQMMTYHYTEHIVNVLLNNFETSLRPCLVCHDTEVSVIKTSWFSVSSAFERSRKIEKGFSFGPFLILFYL